MGIIAWVVVGLVAGGLAKLVVPGREPGGFIATILIGIVGAVLGGWIWNAFFNRAGATGINIGSIVVAFVGAVFVLLIYHAVTRNRSSS